MKNYLIKLLVIITCICCINFAIGATNNKVIFSVEEKFFTTIDIEIRKKYLNLINDNIKYIEKEELVNNYINLIIYDHYFENNKTINDQLNNEVNNEYIKIINNPKNTELLKNLDEKNIRKQIRIDIQRKIIIEERLGKNKDIIFENNFNKINNLYNIEISIISINKKYKESFQNINNIYNLIELKNYLTNKKIDFFIKKNN